MLTQIAFLRHQLGERIQDRYEILRALGCGAFGTVYLCRDSELDTQVAIKELHVLDDPQTAGNEREIALAQFRREAVNLSQLRHPHIVSGHYQPHSGQWRVCPVCGESFPNAATCPQHGAALVELRQRNYLVMEYLGGPDLMEAAQLSGGALKVEDALRYFRQIGGALQMIHARQLVHRDIKPDNIRLRALPGKPHDDAVLLDFGIATQSGEVGDFSTRAFRHTSGGGTSGYAPDSPAERRLPDARSDIHALGMTLYAVLTGRDPLEERDLFAMRNARPRDFNANIPVALENLICKSIDPKPENRPQNAADFLRELDAAAGVPSYNAASTHGLYSLGASTRDPQNGAANGIAPAAATQNGAARNVAVAPPPAFLFRSGERARDLPQLLQLLDVHRQEGKDYLYSGAIESWLRHAGLETLAQRAGEIRLEYPERRYQGLEALAQATGLAAPPTMQIEPRVLDFGTLSPDGLPGARRKTLDLKLRNVGRGHLFGFLRATRPGLFFDDKFEGNRQIIPVTLDAAGLPRGPLRGELILDSSAGEVRVPFCALVRYHASGSAAMAVFFWGSLGMIWGLLTRSLPTASTHDWMNGGSELLWWPAAPLFGFCLWCALILLTIGEATRRRSWSLFLSGSVAAFSTALVAAAAGNALLPLLDSGLKPILEPIVGHWAGGGWAILGGALGAIYGTVRRARDIFSPRLSQLLSGWFFFLLTLAVMLWSMRAVALPSF